MLVMSSGYSKRSELVKVAEEEIMVLLFISSLLDALIWSRCWIFKLLQLLFQSRPETTRKCMNFREIHIPTFYEKKNYTTTYAYESALLKVFPLKGY
jgi:hypothetical protein